MKKRFVAFLIICLMLFSGCQNATPVDTVLQPSNSPITSPVNKPAATPISGEDVSIPLPDATTPTPNIVAPTESPTPIPTPATPEQFVPSLSPASFDVSTLPAYSGTPFVEVNGDKPFFTSSDMTTDAFEMYSSRDSLNRCGVAFANICQDIMPTDERGSIGMVKPSGWHTVRYDDLISDKYLYNRCHLIGFQLAGENANEDNLITGTRYMNTEGMLPFENRVADYVRSTQHHVLYRVTPCFEGDNLLATGVLMEAQSVEDSNLCFCVFTYNVQPFIDIDYATGDSSRSTPTTTPPSETLPSKDIPPANVDTGTEADYIGNKNTKKFHYPTCSSVKDMKEKNKYFYTGTRDGIIAEGYDPCGRCKP